MKNQASATPQPITDNFSQKPRPVLQEDKRFIRPWSPLASGSPTDEDHECGCGCCPDE
jgi:hypothetical protein